ncbi:MAG: F0F1 ATP synthase subunit A [Ignavibacteriaceae bacterium]|nr:F0F1 ATP synthase subunit A [Ignavibacteriaceae bacterium]
MSGDTSKIVADTLKAGAEKTEHSGSDWILHHVMDGNYLDFSPFGKVYLPQIELFGFDLSITRHVFVMWIAAALLVIVFYFASKKYQKTLIPKGFSNLLEVFILFVKNEIAIPTIGKGYERFLPYLLTAFFFILFGNFLGLIPFSATFTSNIAVTAVMATFSFFMIQIGGIRKNGLFGYFKGLIPHGVPVFLLPIMVVVELLGLLTKPFALAIRLFANMTAGHIVIYALISLIFVMQSYLISPVSVGMALFIYGLEILVALLQAYIFTMLSSLFIGMAVHQDH